MPLFANIWANNSRILYYVKHLLEFSTSAEAKAERIRCFLKSATPDQKTDIERRTKYYNQVSQSFTLSEHATPVRINFLKRQRNYQIDLFRYTRLFPRHFKVQRLFGDVRQSPTIPTIVKARPILESGNSNGILLNLNKIRHFKFPTDPIPFSAKRDVLVWRGTATQQNRIRFLEKFYQHPNCDVGHSSKAKTKGPWNKPFLPIKEQLKYKFILSLEGNDVATNLKWILNSNSLCFMPKPKNETWFMEGTLQPDIHYVCVNDDFSNLEEKLNHFTQHPESALAIIRCAKAHVRQFFTPNLEDAIAFNVLLSYFQSSGQI
jgi:hypothetical protein